MIEFFALMNDLIAKKVEFKLMCTIIVLSPKSKNSMNCENKTDDNSVSLMITKFMLGSRFFIYFQ